METTEVAASHGRPQIPYQESVNNSAQQFEGGESEFPPPPPPQMDLFYWYGVPYAVLGVARDMTPFIMPLTTGEIQDSNMERLCPPRLWSGEQTLRQQGREAKVIEAWLADLLDVANSCSREHLRCGVCRLI